MTLSLLHPGVAHRDCEHCLKWLYEPSGQLAVDRAGNPIPRLSSGPSVAPCRQEKLGCPKGTPELKRSLTPQHEQAYKHYLECKAIQRWPNDPMVKQHAGVIRGIEDRVERMECKQLRILLETFLGVAR